MADRQCAMCFNSFYLITFLAVDAAFAYHPVVLLCNAKIVIITQLYLHISLEILLSLVFSALNVRITESVIYRLVWKYKFRVQYLFMPYSFE